MADTDPLSALHTGFLAAVLYILYIDQDEVMGRVTVLLKHILVVNGVNWL